MCCITRLGLFTTVAIVIMSSDLQKTGLDSGIQVGRAVGVQYAYCDHHIYGPGTSGEVVSLGRLK